MKKTAATATWTSGPEPDMFTLMVSDVLARSPKKVNSIVFVGPNLLVLQRYYDVRQLWFPFVCAAFPTAPIEPRRQMANGIKPYIYARINDRDRTLYHFERDQLILPFVEHQNVSKSQWGSLEHVGFPGWELDANGKPFTIRIRPHNRPDTIRWCAETLRGRFHITKMTASFQYENEAVLARLRLG
jgi:hypothetical protein